MGGVNEIMAEDAGLGGEYDRLDEPAREHLSRCSDCREALLAQLKRLEKMEG